MVTKRIVFMGTPEFALPSLQSLVAAGENVVGVFSQPPRPAGRGQKLRPSPVHAWAQAHHIPVFTPEKLDEEATAGLKKLAPDLICVAAYGLLLPLRVLNVAPCINVHPSALPRWRGAAPIQHTILAGDKSTDLCIMAMEKGLDTGAVYLREPYQIPEGTTAGELHDEMATRGGNALVKVVKNWPVTPTPQAEEGVTYAHKITPEMRPTKFNQPAGAVCQHINGLSPFPGATAILGQEVFKLFKAQPAAEGSGQPGQVLATGGALKIACAEGAVEIITLQRPGKKIQNVAEFLKGTPIKEGDVFV